MCMKHLYAECEKVLTKSVLQEIINDVAPNSVTLKRVGLVGSFSRDDFTDKSDVDLVFDTGEKMIDEAVLSAGLKIRSIISNQFDCDVDIINYATIILRANEENSTYCVEGYRKMLEDLKWIWRREI